MDFINRIRSNGNPTPLSFIQSKADLTKAEILIYGTIGVDFWGEGISAKSFSEMLDKLDKNTKEITVRINSPGGSVFDGITIYNRLKQHKAKIITRTDGLAASIASIIFLAGEERIMGTGTSYMIHKPWTWAQGNSDDFDHKAGILLQLEEQMLGIYKNNSNLDKATLAEMLRDETWLRDDQTLEHGFATSIDEEVLAIAASTEGLPWIKRSAPNMSAATKAIKADLSKFQADIDSLLKK